MLSLLTRPTPSAAQTRTDCLFSVDLLSVKLIEDTDSVEGLPTPDELTITTSVDGNQVDQTTDNTLSSGHTERFHKRVLTTTQPKGAFRHTIKAQVDEDDGHPMFMDSGMLTGEVSGTCPPNLDRVLTLRFAIHIRNPRPTIRTDGRVEVKYRIRKEDP